MSGKNHMTSAKSKHIKHVGRSWENDVVAFLRSYGILAERRRLTGCEDCGDVSGWPQVVVEAKACKAMNLAGWMDELWAERANADERYGDGHVGLIFAKRRGYPDPQYGYAIMNTHLAVLALRALLKETSRGQA